MSLIPIRRIARIALTVSDLARSTEFFARGLGFSEMGRERRSGSAYSAIIGIAGASAEVAIMRLGGQEIELTAFTPAGRPYPAERSVTDPWFQHFAIVVSDMAAAYAMLSASLGWTPISTGGPQLLPPETGGIVAFKFRDPDGHPIELSWFPSAIAGAWAKVRSPSPFLGVDHSALAVHDSETSVAFYTDRLGFRQTASQINTGPTQDGLDGLPGATLEITTLVTPEPGPHIELLRYQNAAKPAERVAINDLASTRLVLETAAHHPAVMTSDPDGHLLETRASP